MVDLGAAARRLWIRLAGIEVVLVIALRRVEWLELLFDFLLFPRVDFLWAFMTALWRPRVAIARSKALNKFLSCFEAQS